jgi:hypothetical protein
MTLSLKFDHSAKLITVTARGTVTREDMAECFLAVPREGAVGYRVIVDCSAATKQLSLADLRAFSEIVRSRKSDDFDSAVALIVTSDAERELAAYFEGLTASSRPVRTFKTIAQAKEWFGVLDDEQRRRDASPD